MVEERCFYCLKSEGPFQEDHVVPFSRGGTSLPRNLVLACAPCNQEKSDRLPSEWRADLAPRVYELEKQLLDWHAQTDARKRNGFGLYAGAMVYFIEPGIMAIVEVVDGRGVRYQQVTSVERKVVPVGFSTWQAWSEVKHCYLADREDQQQLDALFEEVKARKTSSRFVDKRLRKVGR